VAELGPVFVIYREREIFAWREIRIQFNIRYIHIQARNMWAPWFRASKELVVASSTWVLILWPNWTFQSGSNQQL
jgi:hypothetical protein